MLKGVGVPGNEAAHKRLIGGCGCTSDMKRGENSKSRDLDLDNICAYAWIVVIICCALFGKTMNKAS